MKRFVIGILGAALLSGMAVWNIIHAEYISGTYDNDIMRILRQDRSHITK